MESGTQLGHYEFLSFLGKGGMGEVWRARDTKLGREVAIKTLPEEFARDADRLARFEREAKLLASLNHPNIAAIHGFEEDNGTHFLVLELVEGDTLADRLNRGAIPVEESLKLALQIADALKAAHDKGVIHRDLKPLNIKITDDENVKVLDFGLAKAFAGDEAEASVSNSPTLSMAATQQGVILGTAAYMSPEQAKGRTVDKRTDVWAFGCVLYEMLTGRQSFGASDVTESLAAVIRSDPQWNTLPENLHPRLREVVERCLRKPVAKRYQDIGDVKVDLEQILDDPGGVLVQPVADVVQARPQSRLPWVAAVALIGIIAGLAGWNLRPLPAGRTTRFEIIPPDSAPLEITNTLSDVAVSPDGTRIVYTATAARNLWVRTLDQIEPVELVTLGQTRNPFFSPDGTQVGFHVQGDNSLMRVSIQGGPPQTIVADIGGNLVGASWGPDNSIVFAPGDGEGLMRVAAVGGEPTALTTADQSEGRIFHSWPEVLPDSRGVLFTTWSGSDETSEIVVLNLETGEQHILVSGGTSPRYVSTGHILYATAGSLWVVPFDLDSLDVTGDSVPIVENVPIKEITGAANFGVSEDGLLFYVSSGDASISDRTLALANRQGAVQILDVPPNFYLRPRISPDGSRLAVQINSNSGPDIWVYDLSGSTQIRRLTLEQDGNNSNPVWTPDSERITFLSDRDETRSVWWQPEDGSVIAERLTSVEGQQMRPVSWSPDGQTLLLIDDGARTLTMSLDNETATPEPLALGTARGQVFSPDGRWIAWDSNRSGQGEIYVSPFPPTGVTYQITTEGGNWPIWSPDGNELFYQLAGRIRSVDISTEPSLAFGNDRVLGIEGASLAAPARRDYDMAPDGERFLMIFPADQDEFTEPPRPQINIVLNWFEELKQRVPVP